MWQALDRGHSMSVHLEESKAGPFVFMGYPSCVPFILIGAWGRTHPSWAACMRQTQAFPLWVRGLC